MSTEDTSADKGTVVDKSAADELKNLKSEFSRKNENLNRELESIKSMLAGVAQTVSQPKRESKPVEKPDPLLDPEAYEEYITNKVSSRMDQSINQNNQRQSQLAALVQNYPELQDANNELTKRAVDAYNRLSNEERMSPNAYKFAVLDAAGDLGVVPMSKRKTDINDESSEDFTTNSSSYSGSRKAGSGKNQKSDKIDDMTLAFAEAIGRPVNDPKYIESLKKTISKKEWTKGSK